MNIDKKNTISYIKSFEHFLNDETRLKIDEDLKDFNIRSFLSISDHLGVNPTLLWNQSIDLEVLRDHQKEKDQSVSIRDIYQKSAHSSSTSLASVLEQIEKYNLRDFIKSHLQIKEKFLESHRPMSILAINDALTLVRHKFTKKDCDQIGYINSQKFLNMEFGNEFKNQKSLAKAYQNFPELIPYVEKNWGYRLVKKKQYQVILETWESEEVCCGQSYTSELTNQCRFSFISNIARGLGYSNVEVKQVSESRASNRKFMFLIDWSNAKKIPKFLKTKQPVLYH